eukprot:7449194-Alexandrium_andersonii.AAC.1
MGGCVVSSLPRAPSCSSLARHPFTAGGTSDLCCNAGGTPTAPVAYSVVDDQVVVAYALAART